MWTTERLCHGGTLNRPSWGLVRRQAIWSIVDQVQYTEQCLRLCSTDCSATYTSVNVPQWPFRAMNQSWERGSNPSRSLSGWIIWDQSSCCLEPLSLTRSTHWTNRPFASSSIVINVLDKITISLRRLAWIANLYSAHCGTKCSRCLLQGQVTIWKWLCIMALIESQGYTTCIEDPPVESMQAAITRKTIQRGTPETTHQLCTGDSTTMR